MNMVSLTPKTTVEVSRKALRENASALRDRTAPDAVFMAVVKSNAYGHGLEGVVNALKDDVDWFGVDSLPEALAVRATGAQQPVLILGHTPTADLARVVHEGFSQICYGEDVLNALATAGTERRPAKIHLKIETGTSRQGIRSDDLGAFLRTLQRLPTVVLEGVSTHYANIEDTDDPDYAMEQLKAFEDAVTTVRSYGHEPTFLHTACSAAILAYPQTHFTMVRAGIALYGLWPSEGIQHRAEGISLTPALTWKTRVAQVKQLPKDTPVSYGLTERLTRDSTIAIIPVGYWDGFDRGLSSSGQVLIRGRRAKVLGRVCMNMCVVDTTDIPNVQEEDEVVLLGHQGSEEVTAEEVARLLDTINYEVVTRINPMTPRIMI